MRKGTRNRLRVATTVAGLAVIPGWMFIGCSGAETGPVTPRVSRAPELPVQMELFGASSGTDTTGTPPPDDFRGIIRRGTTWGKVKRQYRGDRAEKGRGSRKQ